MSAQAEARRFEVDLAKPGGDELDDDEETETVRARKTTRAATAQTVKAPPAKKSRPGRRQDPTKTCSRCGQLNAHHRAGCLRAGGRLKPTRAKATPGTTRASRRMPPATPSKGPEPEIAALEGVLLSLAPIQFEEQRRVIRYACERFSIDPAKLAP